MREYLLDQPQRRCTRHPFRSLAVIRFLELASIALMIAIAVVLIPAFQYGIATVLSR